MLIQGRVQGVWYRGWTVETARALGLGGWVRNCRDGAVEAVFSGLATDVDAMLNHCHQGPPAAQVQSVAAVVWNEPVATGFRQLPDE